MSETEHERTPVPPGGGAAERLREFQAARGDITPDEGAPDEDGPDEDGPDEDGPDEDGPDEDAPDGAAADESPEQP